MQGDTADLIDRMSDASSASSSDESVSWQAYREAERLRDEAIVDELAARRPHEKSKARRSAMYFIIGKIAKNVRSPACARTLLDFVRDERDKYNVARILDLVGDIPKPADFDLGTAFALLSDRRWLIRHAAIRALDNSTSVEAEHRLVDHLRATTDPHDQTYCHAVLNHIGTSASIPAIEASLSSRKRDVKLPAQLALESIRARNAKRG